MEPGKAKFASEHGPNRVDIHVGSQVRKRRKSLGLSQEALAQSIGLTFQQVQKYERGANRISASKLFEISKALKTKPGRFFDGLDNAEGREEFFLTQPEANVSAFLNTTEGLEIAHAFPAIKKPAIRRKILELVRAIGLNQIDRGEPPG